MPAGVADVLGTVARHRLPEDAVTSTAAPLVVDAEGWTAVASTLSRERLTGLAALAVADGALVLDHEGDLADLAERDRHVQAQALAAERLTLELCSQLAADGVPHLVLKGPATAHGPYPGPATRPFVDVDLLVPGQAIDAVVASWQAKGVTRPVPQLRPGFDQRFAKSVTLRHPSGVEIDLHRTLVLGPLTHLVALADLWDRPDSVAVVPGGRIPVLHRDVAFLHACLHASAAGWPRWLTLRDVVETGRGADLDRCRAIARRWKATAVVATAVAAAHERGLPTGPRLASWAESLAPAASERRVAAAYLPMQPSSRRLVLAGWRHVHGPLGKLAFARALVFPSAAHRQARDRSLGEDARRALGRAT